MIYDCFSFFNELDLLEIRLNELNPVVDKFVLVEATITHNGDKKPLYYAENKSRFEKFAEKIIHVVVGAEDMKRAEAGETFQKRAWMRENIQRNAISKGLANASGEDVIMVSDLDEIPKAEKVSEVASGLKHGEVIGFILNAYNFYINLRNVSDPYWGNDPKIARVSTFSDETAYITSPYNLFILPEVNSCVSATRFRYIKPTRRIPNAGWHLSYLGGVKAAVAKVKAFNEVGLSVRRDIETYVAKRIASGKALWGGDRFLPEPIDETLPEFVLSNQEIFAPLIYQNVPPQGFQMYLLRKWIYISACARRLTMSLLLWATPKWIRTKIKKVLGYNF